mmetsp:Transcript_2732/g.10711  ORF Transcript_2732/g.10711 Transcript_2732/m.10711 type:complete len:224 (-) Transcript_2732:172-843(-)
MPRPTATLYGIAPRAHVKILRRGAAKVAVGVEHEAVGPVRVRHEQWDRHGIKLVEGHERMLPRDQHDRPVCSHLPEAQLGVGVGHREAHRIAFRHEVPHGAAQGHPHELRARDEHRVLHPGRNISGIGVGRLRPHNRQGNTCGLIRDLLRQQRVVSEQNDLRLRHQVIQQAPKLGPSARAVEVVSGTLPEQRQTEVAEHRHPHGLLKHRADDERARAQEDVDA